MHTYIHTTALTAPVTLMIGITNSVGGHPVEVSAHEQSRTLSHIVSRTFGVC